MHLFILDVYQILVMPLNSDKPDARLQVTYLFLIQEVLENQCSMQQTKLYITVLYSVCCTLLNSNNFLNEKQGIHLQWQCGLTKLEPICS